MADLLIEENGDGGDLVLLGNDLVSIEGFQNMPYLGLFGGNVASETKEFNDGEQRLDWWANALLFQNDSSIQFNSNLERVLREVPLSSSGRLKIEQTAKEDLKFMDDFAEVTVSVSIIDINRVKIDIKIQEPANLEATNFIYIWDSTRLELTNTSS